MASACQILLLATLQAPLTATAGERPSRNVTPLFPQHTFQTPLTASLLTLTPLTAVVPTLLTAAFPMI